MGNHVHLLVQMKLGRHYSDEDIQKRYVMLYGKDAVMPAEFNKATPINAASLLKK